MKIPQLKKLTWKKIYVEYKFMIITAVIALVLMGLVVIFVKNEIDRFTFIMPIFASWILACILFDIPDEDEETAGAKKAK